MIITNLPTTQLRPEGAQSIVGYGPSNLMSLPFFKKTFFCLLSLCSSDPNFCSPFFLFASRISTIFTIYAVRYHHFASVNSVAYLRGNFCFAAPIFVSITSFCPFRAFVGVCEEWIELCSISSSLARKMTSLAVWQERFEGFCFTKKLLNVLNGTDAGTNDKQNKIWASLVQCLDSRSIRMLTNDCKGDGLKA